MVKLFCAVVGVGSVFSVEIDISETVGDLKNKIKERKPGLINFDADLLKLYLAREGDTWLNSRDADMKALKRGEIPDRIKSLMQEELLLDEAATLDDEEYFRANFKPRNRDIHVLVELPTQHVLPRTVASAAASSMAIPAGEPTEICITVEEVRDAEEDWQELLYYQRRGRLIQDKCGGYCAHILDKVDEFYDGNERPLPFICVEGSSGMGKSQLAFALGGRRPWYYWLATSVGSDSQRLYRNFRSISGAFHSVVNRDNPRGESRDDILNSTSRVYRNDPLWTYGFICALLEHCSSAEHRSARQMIRFDNATRLNVKPCDLETVRAVIEKMKREKKMLPFFVLDEMDIESGGVNTAAFQRNVFRACGLVVIVMGTDSKITNLMKQVTGSYSVLCRWMALVPVFPSYQIVLNTLEQQTWLKLVAKYPVVQDIVTRSRARFARYFMERVVECLIQSSETELSRLLDEGCGHVSLISHEGKAFLNSVEGQRAQLMAISYTNAVVCRQIKQSHQKKRRDWKWELLECICILRI